METMNTKKKKKKKGWIGIFALAMALVFALAACNKGDTPGADTSPEGTANESAISSEELTNSGEESTEDATDTSGETDETTSLEGPESTSEDIPEDESEDGDTTESAVPDDTEEVTTEPEETTEEAAKTLPEETTEEAATTLEGSTENTEPAATTTKEKETTKASSSQNPTPGATTTAAPPETTKGTTPTQPTTPAPTTTAAPTQPSHKHSYSGRVTKQPTCGATGIKTYTCSCGDSYTETIPATGNHSWVEQMRTVHHPAETHVVHHDAVTHIVHHDEVSHQEWVVDRPAYDEPITETHDICNSCGADLTKMYYENGGNDIVYSEHGNCHFPSWHTEQVVVGYTHHDEVGHYQKVVDTPAWDETVIDQPAWDETVVDREAWDETVHDCYKCSVCGATKP